MNGQKSSPAGRTHWVRWASAGIGIVAVIAAFAAASCSGTGTGSSTSTPAQPAAMNPDELIARGKQISFSSGCVDCHTPGTLYGTPDTTRMLSGSELGWEGPWGVSFPRNLTPDMETGIGSWTEDQIIAAFRTGHRPEYEEQVAWHVDFDDP